jgi:hypothetical protein
MATTVGVDLEHEVVDLGSVAAAQEAVSSELSSYEAIALGDLTPEQIVFIASNSGKDALHKRNQEVGIVVMKFHRFFEQFKPLVVAMKAKMCGARGSHLRTMIDGTYMSWSEYCRTYYGVSYRWVQKLINGDYQHVPGEQEVQDVQTATDEQVDVDAEQTEEPKLSKKDRVIVELEKKNDELKAHIDTMKGELEKARAEFLLKLAEKKHELQIATEEDGDDVEPPSVVEPKPTLDSRDPYAYFDQFRDEPQTMAGELAAMLLEFHMDEQQTAIILDLLKKELKAQRKMAA